MAMHRCSCRWCTSIFSSAPLVSTRAGIEEVTVSETRIEKDSLGEVEVPAGAYYGAQTERARRNFPVSGLRFPRRFIAALGAIKREAAAVNGELGLVPGELEVPADAYYGAQTERAR